jgi:nucleoside-diphosphate-sugar epimerase
MISADRVTLLGATGQVERRILTQLLDSGIGVVAVSRQPRPAAMPRAVEWYRADLRKSGDLADVPSTGILISTVFVSLTADVVEALPRDELERVVAFSSTSAQTKVEATESEDRDVASRLRFGEQRLLDRELDVTILRPTMIYHGPGDQHVERIAWQLKHFPLFPLIGSGSGLRQPVHADDLATAAAKVVTIHPAVKGTYNVAGGEVLPFREMVSRVADANREVARFVSIPLPLARTTLRPLSPLPRFRGIPLGALERMSKDLVFDISDARIDFGYAPRPFEPPMYRE